MYEYLEERIRHLCHQVVESEEHYGFIVLFFMKPLSLKATLWPFTQSNRI